MPQQDSYSTVTELDDDHYFNVFKVATTDSTKKISKVNLAAELAGDLTAVEARVTTLEGYEQTAGYFHAQDQKSTGTPGGTGSASSWNNRALNTEVTNTMSSSVSLNTTTGEITFEIGTYYLDTQSTAYRVGKQRGRVYDTLNSASLFVGVSQVNNTAGIQSKIATASQRVTFTEQTTVKLQAYMLNSLSTSDLGAPTSDGSNEIYADFKAWKIIV